MTVEEFYNSIGGDYQKALKTLMNDKIAAKFIAMYPGDPNHQKLVEAFETRDPDVMFRAAHAFKGVTLNLGFKVLGEKIVILTDTLRENSGERNNFELLEKYLKEVNFEYDKVIAQISAFVS